MEPKKPTDLLFEADDQTVSRIAAQCPPDWDTEKAFRQSYRKYKALQNHKPVPRIRRFDFDPLRSMVTAACLLVTVGGAGFLWYLRNAAPPPDMTLQVETAPTAASESDAAPEPSESAAVTLTAETQKTTGTSVSRSAGLHETKTERRTEPAAAETSVTVQTASGTSPAHTAAVSAQTTASAPQKPAQTSVRTVPAIVSHAPADTPSALTETVPSATDTTPEPDDGQTAPTAAALSESDTAAQVTGTTAEGAQPAAETAATDQQETKDADPPAADPQETTEPDDESGFLVSESGDIAYVRFVNNGEHQEFPEISLDLEGYTLPEPKESKTYLDFRLEQEGRETTILFQHFHYEAFNYSCRRDLIGLYPTTVNGREAYYSITDTGPYTDDIYTFFWDDGAGVALISSQFPSLEAVTELAEHLVFTP